jgi:hypothetical protein
MAEGVESKEAVACGSLLIYKHLLISGNEKDDDTKVLTVENADATETNGSKVGRE